MADLHTVYHTMNSLAFRMGLSRDRTERIATIVAHEQHAAAAMLPAVKGRGNNARARRLAFWADEVRKHGWPDGLGS
jgi:hypothetical protein